MTTATEIRPLERADLPELVDLCREHARYERARWTEDAGREARLGRLLLDSDGADCWVAEVRAGRLAGFASASFELSTWDARHYLHLDCLYLREPYRGHGVGRALIERVAQTALDQGAVNLQWQTPPWNGGAVRFYERLGAEALEKLRFSLDSEGCRRLVGNTTVPPSRSTR